MSDSMNGEGCRRPSGTSGGSHRTETARGEALLRALAAVEEREEIRGADRLAEIFLAEERKGSLKEPAIREWLLNNYLPKGVYAYSLARTAYFDRVVEQALRENIDQMVIIGAGYDSRPYRFAQLAAETNIFELDEAEIQARKRRLLKQADVAIPGRLVYAPFCFGDAGRLGETLEKAGFDESKQSLFVLEGVTGSLTEREVADILDFIKSHAPAGSTVCFDYGSIPSDTAEPDGMDELKGIFAPQEKADPGRFTVEQGKIGMFLAKKDFMVLDHLAAEDMERKFLLLRDGSTAGKVPARHCIVYASLAG